MDVRFGWINYTVLFLYLAAMVGVGIRFAGRQKSTEDYFLAGRAMPWWPVAMSMFASLTSAVTFMGLPSLAFREGVALIVVCVVSPVLAPFLVYGLYPVYRRHHVTTSYEFIGTLYGQPGRLVVSCLFVLARVGWMGTVIYAPALALQVATGIPLPAGILVMGLVATLYTGLGGLAAVLWTDVAQFAILVAGAIGVAVSLVASVPGGVVGIISAAHESGHLHVALRPSLFEMSALVVAVSFFLQMMQDYGTDQVTVQRMLAVRDNRGVGKATFFNAGTDVVMIAMLLFIGLGMFVFYRQNPGLLAADMPSDSLLPYYIMTRFPPGVSGLIVSAIFAAAMSSMDSGINSLATVVEHDILRPLRRRPHSDHSDLVSARVLTVVLGVAATALAFGVARIGHIIKAFATFMGLFNAPVLALFVLGFLGARGRFSAWVVGLCVSIPATLWLQRVVEAHWVYYFPFSFSVTFVTAWVLGLWLPAAQARRHGEGDRR